MMFFGKSIFCRGKEVITGVHITEEEGNDELSVIDIKAAIAKQNIPVSELYSKQDLASNESVIALILEAKTKTKKGLVEEKVILEKKAKDLQAFKDKADTLGLIKTSKELTDKNERTIEYIRDRLATGRGVDLSGDLTDAQRQDKVNAAIKEELELMTRQGIIFKAKDDKESDKKPFGSEEEEDDMTDPEKNVLIPQEEKKE